MPAEYDLIIVGGGLSGLTAAYRAHQRGWKFLLLESSQRFGGSLHTDYQGGLVQELGAESMVLAKPWGRDLCLELGLGDQLVTPMPEYRRTLIARNGRLVPIPEGLRLLAPSQWLPFLRSPALSWPGKLRMGLEFLLPPRRGSDDESLASFVRRRLGREALQRIAQPLVAGIYTADPETLSMQATLPQFLDYEQKYGSVCWGLLMSPEARASSGPRYQLFTSLKKGFQQLIDALVQKLPPESLRLDYRVQSLRAGPPWEVDGFESQRVLLATPTYEAARCLKFLDAGLAQHLEQQQYLSSATVNLVYPAEAVDRATRAYGFVVPAVENSDILACTFSHRKYPGRTPESLALLRTYIGGAARPEAVEWSDQQMVERSHAALAHLLRIRQAPLQSQVMRYRKAMPLYRVGHLSWVGILEDRLAAWPRLELTGNAYRGVGIPDCIRLAGEKIQRWSDNDSA